MTFALIVSSICLAMAASMKPIVRPTSIDRGPEVGPGPPAILVNPAAPPASESVATGAGPRAGIPDGVATTFFDVPARGRSIVYLIDASSSMGPSGALALATRELLASLARLPAGARFQVLTYNSRVTPLLPRYPEGMPASPLMLDQVAQALRELEPVGATDHGRALREALNLRSDALFFLTDADDLDLPEEFLLLGRDLGPREVLEDLQEFLPVLARGSLRCDLAERVRFP